jgi:hypothetical protein
MGILGDAHPNRGQNNENLQLSKAFPENRLQSTTHAGIQPGGENKPKQLNSISKSGNRGNHSSQQHPKPLDNLNAEKFMCKIPESTLPSPTISPQTVSTPAEETWQADFSRYTIVEKRIWLVSSTLFSPANASSNHHRSP